MEDPQAPISDASLRSLIEDIRKETPFAGVSLLYESTRSRGIKVTREQVRSSLRSVDPLRSALEHHLAQPQDDHTLYLDLIHCGILV